MRYTQSQTEHEVTLEPAAPAVASVVLLHGLGADGTDFVPIVDELRLPDALPVRFVFPHAPLRPVTVNAGYVMRAWYDIRSFTPEGRADAAGLAQSVGHVNGCLRHEIARGVEASRIVLAGFSQGGAVALAAGLRFPQRLAGILALSAYLPFPQALATEQVGRQCGRADTDVSRATRSGRARHARAGSSRSAHRARLPRRVARVPDAARGVCGGDCGSRAVARGATPRGVRSCAARENSFTRPGGTR